MHIPAPVTLVTGSSRGIGAQIAKSFLERGDKVHVVWRSADEVPHEDDFRGRTHRADLTQPAEVEALIERILLIDGKIDHVVHCVGDYHSASLDETSAAEWRALIDSNLMSAVHLATALREAASESLGTLVFLSCAGVSRWRARRKIAAYAAAKSALASFARSLALECAPDGLRVNMISPGLIPHVDAHADTQSSDLHAQVPLGRAGTLEEIALAALWLSSSRSSYVVGIDLEISGGWPT